MSPPVDITVLIPTRDRPQHVSQLVRALQAILPRFPALQWEVVISDNHSGPGTCAAPGTGPLDVRVVRPPHPLETAEENLFFGLTHSTGRFIWILGDDDIVNPDAIGTLVECVTSDRHDLLIFNATMIDHAGVPITPMRTLCHAPQLEIPLADFVARAGFWYALAGFSTVVLRRDRLDPDRARELLSISRIYSHVAYLLDRYHDAKFAFVNVSLVAYRQNAHDLGGGTHWIDVARRLRVPYRFSWTTGFVRLLVELETRGVLAHSTVGDILDQSIDRRFFFVHHMAGVLLEQIARNDMLPDALRMPRPDVEECLGYLESVAPRDSELWRKLRYLTEASFCGRLTASSAGFRQSVREAESYIDALMRQSHSLRRFVGMEGPYALYRTHNGTCRVRLSMLGLLIEQDRWIDPVSVGDDLIFDAHRSGSGHIASQAISPEAVAAWVSAHRFSGTDKPPSTARPPWVRRKLNRMGRMLAKARTRLGSL